MKRPSFQFYPGDWLRDTALRSCSVPARGLWIDMIALMHEGTPYGYLKVGSKVILPDNLARIVGAAPNEVAGWLMELEAANVFSRDGDCIFSRRMIRDEEIRAARAAGGVLGGNPELKKRPPTKVNHSTNQEPTPSSASSSSSASASASASVSSKDQGPNLIAAAPKTARTATESKETWDAYIQAYEKRYRTPPIRNLKQNSLMKQFVSRVGVANAPAIAQFFVAHNERYYANSGHSLAALLRDAEKLHTEWVTGQRMTSTKALQIDRTQSNLDAFAPLLAEADAREARHGDQKTH